jgi:hypothetical protein
MALMLPASEWLPIIFGFAMILRCGACWPPR